MVRRRGVSLQPIPNSCSLAEGAFSSRWRLARSALQGGCEAPCCRFGGDMAQISETTLRQQLADCHRMMVMAELLDYSGHVSARIPGTDRILILPRDASRAGVTADDMLVVGLDGKVLDGNRLPPTETAIHLGVYRARADVHAVGHGHPPMATLVTKIGRASCRESGAIS